ncbi:hypothetical protein [Faecalibaculum rodentium]|uniref:hypothetical protein n=1 Tax=Faecalibaculum rodentium TaxID=1702221 RepID=UPI00272CE1D0|nr:hypothetical protein [Faecalibaculum rodentium]
MSTDSTQGLATAALHISIHAGATLVETLRKALTALQYANVKYGEDHYRDFLKTKGMRFRTQMGFVRVAADKKSDVERAAVSKDELNLLKRLAKKHGLDYCLTRKPKDLQKLIDRKFKNGEELSPQEEKMIRAFTFRDSSGNTLMDSEHPELPQINSAEYMFTIRTDSLAHWDVVCREMESRLQHPTFDDRLRNAVNLSKIREIYKAKKQDRAQERFQEQVPKVKQPPVSHKGRKGRNR